MIQMAECGIVVVEFELKDALFLSTELENVLLCKCTSAEMFLSALRGELSLQLQLAVFLMKSVEFAMNCSLAKFHLYNGKAPFNREHYRAPTHASDECCRRFSFQSLTNNRLFLQGLWSFDIVFARNADITWGHNKCLLFRAIKNIST